jgi:hypothetical protein
VAYCRCSGGGWTIVNLSVVDFRLPEKILFESTELVVRMVFDYKILNGRPFRATLRPGFYVNVRHGVSP